MLNIPILRWGQPYTSMDVDEVIHFATGEPIAKVGRANGGLIQRDIRTIQAQAQYLGHTSHLVTRNRNSTDRPMA